MKKATFRAMLLLLGVSAVMGCEKHNSDEPDRSADGISVWEGPMTIADDGSATVKILNITNDATAEFYEMVYTLSNGYEIKNKETSAIDITDGDKSNPTCFSATVSGNKVTFTREGNTLVCDDAAKAASVSIASTDASEDEVEDSPTVYILTANNINHYKSVQLSPSLLPTDSEYTGPKQLNVSLLSDSQVSEDLTLLTESFDWVEFLTWAGKTAATTAWGKGVGVLLDMLFPASGEATTLDDLLDKMNSISNQLTQMTNLYKNTTYESYLNQRSKQVSELANCNSVYFTRLSNASTDDEAETEANVKAIVLDWAKNTVGGNPVWSQGLNYMDWLMNTVIEKRDIFNMYDLYTYNTTAWESQGYAIREALRASDIATVAQTLYLTQLYHKVRDDIDEFSRKKTLEDNIARFEEFSEYIKNRPVERHEDMGICQIEGAHFVMDKYALDYPNYRNPSWCTIPCRWTRYDSDVYFMWGPNQAENYSKALTPNEVRRIFEYYEGSDRTLYEIFNEDANIKLGAHIVTSYYNGVIPLQSNYYSPDWDYVGVDAAVFLRSAKSASDIKPTACGHASLGASGWQMKLTFLKWYEYYSDYTWTRTNVIER